MRRLTKREVMALVLFGVFYVTFGILLVLFQERVVYHPNAQSFENCADFVHAEKVIREGTRMYAYNTEKAPVVILYHGNAGSACDRSFYADIFTQAGYGYVIVEYAGYSDDAHKPSHEQIKKDVQNVIAYTKEKSIVDITVVGESIGTGAASYHVSLGPPEKLLLISPFTDLGDIAKGRFWFYPTQLLVDNAFDNVALLREYLRTTTVIHGNNDTVIPYKLGRELFESLKAEKEFVTIEGAGHNDLFSYPETYTAVMDFLGRH